MYPSEVCPYHTFLQKYEKEENVESDYSVYQNLRNLCACAIKTTANGDKNIRMRHVHVSVGDDTGLVLVCHTLVVEDVLTVHHLGGQGVAVLVLAPFNRAGPAVGAVKCRWGKGKYGMSYGGANKEDSYCYTDDT